jgi:hypothetical protein
VDAAYLPNGPGPVGPGLVTALVIFLCYHLTAALETADVLDDVMPNRFIDCIIGCAFDVMNTLGCAFLDKVYENVRIHEFRKAGLGIAQQHGIKVADNDMMLWNTSLIWWSRTPSSLN